jgi:hypothetical protein
MDPPAASARWPAGRMAALLLLQGAAARACAVLAGCADAMADAAVLCCVGNVTGR